MGVRVGGEVKGSGITVLFEQSKLKCASSVKFVGFFHCCSQNQKMNPRQHSIEAQANQVNIPGLYFLHTMILQICLMLTVDLSACDWPIEVCYLVKTETLKWII